MSSFFLIIFHFVLNKLQAASKSEKRVKAKATATAAAKAGFPIEAFGNDQGGIGSAEDS